MGKCALTAMVCPMTNDKKAKYFCPLWTEFGVVWKNDKGEERFFNCAAEALMPTCVEVIKSVSRPVAEIEAVRNSIVDGFSAICSLATRRMEIE
jgi:hypothetical protein